MYTYIRETKRAFETRIREHKAATRPGDREVSHSRAHLGTAAPNTVGGDQCVD